MTTKNTTASGTSLFEDQPSSADAPSQAPHGPAQNDSPGEVPPTPPADGTPSEPPGDSPRDPHRLAEQFLRDENYIRIRPIVFWQDAWWQWTGARYREVPQPDLSARLVRSIRNGLVRARDAVAKEMNEKGKPRGVDVTVTRGLVADAMQALRSLVALPSFLTAPVWLSGRQPSGVHSSLFAVANGLVTLDHDSDNPTTLLDHSEHYFSLVAVSYRFDPAATCSKFMAFLDQMFEGDGQRIALIGEWFGYLLESSHEHQRFLVLIGEGGDGKSVLLKILVALLGPDNVSHVPLELFGERFQLTATLGKLANIVSEIGDIDRVAEGVLKSFTAGDAMFFDRKNLPGINARPTARPVFSTNNLPQFRDRSRGLLRRMTLMPCRVSLPEARQDKKLDRQIIATELPGILNFALEGRRRLQRQGRFTEPAVCREALEDFRLNANPTRAYLEEVFTGDNSALPVRCDTVRASYEGWCKANGYRPLDSGQFGREIKRAFPSVRRKKIQTLEGRVWAYEGIAFRQTDE